nr:hypothetical protein [Tanacetum cinerariifolium]
MVDDLLCTRIGYATRIDLESYTKEFKKKAQEERKLYIDVVEKSVKDIIKDEVKSLLPQILSKVVSDFATPMIQNTINELVKNVFLAKSSSQPKSIYESLKRDREDKDKDEDPSAGSGREEPVFETANTEMPQDLGGNTEDQPNVEANPKDDWFKKPNKPPTLDRAWNDGKYIDSRPPQKWIRNIAKARQPPRTFDELMSTPIDFSAYVMYNLKIDNLTQEILVEVLAGSTQLLQQKPRLLNMIILKDRRHGFDIMKSSKVAYNNFSMKRVIAVNYIKVMKWYDYGYLEEIIVRREDQTLHKFKEGKFPRLNLRDIKDLLLLLVQKKLSNLEKDAIFDLNVALRMFTRCVVILKRVEDL